MDRQRPEPRTAVVVTVIALVAGLALILAPRASAQQPDGAAISATERTPAFVAAVTDASTDRSHLVAVDEQRRMRSLTAGPFDDSPTVSPDGARVAFVHSNEPGETGLLGVVDLGSGAVVMTDIAIDRSRPLRWDSNETLITTVEGGIVQILPEARSVTFVEGTSDRQSMVEVLPARDGAPARILASETAEDPQNEPPVVVEVVDGQRRVVADPAPNSPFFVSRGAYGPDGSLILVTEYSSSGLGSAWDLAYVDPSGDLASDDQYGGEDLLLPTSGPFWRPQGGAMLLGAATQNLFPSGPDDPMPSALLVDGPGDGRDRTIVSAERPNLFTALGWTPGGDAAVALLANERGTSLALVDDDGELTSYQLELGGPLTNRSGDAPSAALLPPVRRVGGSSRVDTAVAVSQETFPSSETTTALAETVVLARADAYADALAGAPLARSLRAPLLLTGSDGLDAAVSVELERLGASEVILLGGSEALGPQVAADLAAMRLDVARVAGLDRFATAVAIAGELPATSTAILAKGADPALTGGWPDAVSAAPLAAASGAPLLLATADGLPAVTAEALGDLAPDELVIVGGEVAISADVAATAGEAAGAAAVRLGGADRIGTSLEVARSMQAAGLGSSSSLWLATASNWPDALAAGPAVAADGGLLGLADADGNAPPLIELLDLADADVVRLVGGPEAIGGPGLRQRIEALGLDIGEVETIDIP